MPNTSECCCGDNCGTCFYGISTAEDDWEQCTISIEEELRMIRTRPAAHTRSLCTWQGCAGCATADPHGFETGVTYPSEFDIVVKYNHFHVEPSEICTWYYDRKNYGMNPPCLGGFPNSLTCYNTPADTQCCQNLVSNNCRNGFREIESIYQNSNSWYLKEMSHKQARMVLGQDIPSNPNTDYAGTIDYPHNDVYRWLDGIANYNTTDMFPRFEYSTAAGNVVRFPNAPLLETLAFVVHREKWWERYNNNLRQDQNPNSNVLDGPANCASPSHFFFGCTGIPIFQWEILHALGGDQTATAEALLRVFHGQPLQESLMSALQETGALDIQDWKRDDGRCIRKILRPIDSNDVPQDTIEHYLYGRYGGWGHVCHDTISDNQGEWESYWPQVTRNHANYCAADGTTFSQKCMTAAPIPRGEDSISCYQISNSQCNICNDTGPPACGGSAGSVTCAACGALTGDDCDSDVVSMNCVGARFRYLSYLVRIPSTRYPDKYDCDDNEAVLYRCDSNGTILRNEDLSLKELPEAPRHYVPNTVSKSVLRGDTPKETACCSIWGGIISPFGSYTCVVKPPRAKDCPTNSIGGGTSPLVPLKVWRI